MRWVAVVNREGGWQLRPEGPGSKSAEDCKLYWLFRSVNIAILCTFILSHGIKWVRINYDLFDIVGDLNFN